MMASSGPKRISLMTPLVTTAGALGIVQGLGWTLCCIVGILFHTKVIIADSTTGIANSIYSIYLDQDNNNNSGIIRSREFSYFLYIYLVLSFGWMVISSVLLWASIKGKGDAFYGKAIGGWTLITGVVSLLDLILVSLISADYVSYKKSGNSVTELTAVGIVMTMAARGFVLWIVNVTFAIILGKHCYKMYKKDAANQNRAPIDAYASAPVPWLDPSLYNDNSNGHDNKAYKDDDNSSIGPNFMENRDVQVNNKYSNSNRLNNARELPQVSLRKPNDSNYYWNNRNQNKPNPRAFSEAESISPYAQTTPARTAKIGRQAGQRSPPLNVAPPFIPDPDYSPPGSPKVRGVLRPKSNYADFSMY